uniref:Fas death domain-associated protein n=2 Tax=Schistosoma japonicum TaxID=6182 RepID=C1LKT5_SCHJA|nr:Fas death domain-associated protein [Schistosoma japonicum]
MCSTWSYFKIEVSKPILDKCISEIAFNPDRIYVILNDLKTTFRLHTPKIDKKCQQGAVKRRLSFKTISQSVESSHIKPQDSSTSCVGDHILHKDSSPQSHSLGDDDVIIVDSPPPGSPKIIRPSLSNSVQSSSGSSKNSSLENDCAKKAKYTDDNDTDGSDVQNDKRCKIIARLEHLMTRLSQSIRELEEKELDLDELDSSNSPYLKLDVLKRQYLKAWHRHCELRNVARISGRILRQRFTYNGCQYPKVNEKIEEIINKRRLFPDWTDIYRIIASVNKEEKLDLTGSAIKSLAREIFIDVGHSLKQRRQDDLRHDFGCHLTDDICDDDDPTYSSRDLRRKLTENKRLGETNLNKVFKHYIDLQHTIQSAQQIIQNPECVNKVENNVNPHSSDMMGSSSAASVFNQTCPSTNIEHLETNKLHNSPSTSDEIYTLSSDSDEEENVTKSSVNTSDFVSSSSVIGCDELSSTIDRSQESPIKSDLQNKMNENNVSLNSSSYVPVTGSPTTTIDLLDDDTSSPTCSVLAPLEKLPRSDYSRVFPALPPTSVTHNNIFTFSTPILQETRQSSRIVTVATRFGQHRHIDTFSHMASEHIVHRYPVTTTSPALSTCKPHRESNQHFVNNSYNCSSSVVQLNSCSCTFNPLIPHQNNNNSSKFLNITTSYLSPNSNPLNNSDNLILSSTNLPKVCENETIEID